MTYFINLKCWNEKEGPTDTHMHAAPTTAFQIHLHKTPFLRQFVNSLYGKEGMKKGLGKGVGKRVVWVRAIIKRFVNQRLSGLSGRGMYGPVSRLTPLVTLVINVHFWVICIDCMTCNKLVECGIESAWWSLSGIELSVYTHTGEWYCDVYIC